MSGAMDLLATTPLKQSAPAALRTQDADRTSDQAPIGTAEAKTGFASDLAEEEAELAAAASVASEPAVASAEPAVAEPQTASEPALNTVALEAAGIAAMNAFIFPTTEAQALQSLPTDALVDDVVVATVLPATHAMTAAVSTPAAAETPAAMSALGAVPNTEPSARTTTTASALPEAAESGDKATQVTNAPLQAEAKPAATPVLKAARDAQTVVQASAIETISTATSTVHAATPTVAAPVASALEAAVSSESAAPAVTTETPRKLARPVAARPAASNEASLAPLATEAPALADSGDATLPVAAVGAASGQQDLLSGERADVASTLTAERGGLAAVSATPSLTPVTATLALPAQPIATHASTNIALVGNEPQRALTPAERQFAVDEVRMHLATARPEVTIILDPPALGEVHVHLMVQQGAVKAEIRAEHSDVADSLRAELVTLRNALEEAGLTVADVQVKTRDDGRASTQNSAQHDLQREERQSAANSREKNAGARLQATQDASTRRAATARNQRKNSSGVNALDVTI